MNCEEMWVLLSIWADGEANPEESRIVEDHLLVCDHCRKEAAFLQSSSLMLSAIPEVEPPFSLRENILAATIYRPTLAGRVKSAVGSWFIPAPVRVFQMGAAITVLLAGLIAIYQFGAGNRASFQSASLPNSTFEKSRIAGISNSENIRKSETKTDLMTANALPSDSVNAKSIPVIQQAMSARNHRSTAKMSMASLSHEISLRHKAPSSLKFSNSPTAASEMRIKAPADVDDSTTVIASSGNTAGSIAVHPEAIAPETHDVSAPTVIATPAPIVKEQPVRIALSAGAPTISTDQIATLGDLKRSLKDHENDWGSSSMPVRPDSHEIRVDIVHSNW